MGLVLTLVSGVSAAGHTQDVMRALPTHVIAPADNPTTPEKIALGRLLFWDPILSGHKDVACATCHHPDFGYAENLDVSIGVNGTGLSAARTFAAGTPAHFVKRNSQTVLNTAFNGIGTSGHYAPAAAPMFWDTRVRSLEAQALEPIKALEEMRGTAFTAERALATVVARLAAIPEYRAQFARAFGSSDAVTEVNLGRALAAFERSLVANNAPFDQYMRGDSTAMTAEQIRGMNRFRAAGCANCHSGPMFSDYESHVLGVPENGKLSMPDAGVSDTYAFRTASLRNLASTAPYMHNGTLASLQDVIAFYNRAGRVGRDGRGGRGGGGFGGRTQNPNVTRDQLDPLLLQLNLRGGRQNELIAFLQALDDQSFDRIVPQRVPSGLSVGGRTGR